MNDTPGAGHNSKSIVAQDIKAFIERAERLENDRANIGADMRELFKEAKGKGFDVRAMRQVIKLRKMDKADRQEREAMVQLYLDAVGE
jgi:uncharacterized protein (UPF0335 family)